MGQVVQTNGDYTIKTAENGTIILDTGENVGIVRVTGNLIVTGDTLTVSADNLNVKDNVIVLNFGETGTTFSPGGGVTLQYSGIQVDRGIIPSASILFDETDDTWLFTRGAAPGPFNFVDSAIKVRYVRTNSDTDDGDLTLVGTGTGVVKVAGTLNYELQVTDDDDIPNKKYVDDAIISQPSFQIVANDTRVIVADKERDTFPPDPLIAGSIAFFEDQTGFNTVGQSAISVIIDGFLNSQFYTNRTEIFGLEFNSFEITTKDGVTNENIRIRTQGTGRLETNYALQIETIPTIPAPVANSSTLFSNIPSIGTTGLYFSNTTTNGELISKNKALLFSMIF
jgi:hypothetical protein